MSSPCEEQLKCCLSLLQGKEAMLRQMSQGLRQMHRLLRSMLPVLQEKDKLLKYVSEEVDRVKGLFEQKEVRLTGERDAAKQAAQQLATERGQLEGRLRELEPQLVELPAQLEVLPALLPGLICTRAA